MSRSFIDGTAALPLRPPLSPVAQLRPRPPLRLVSEPPAGDGRSGAASAGTARLTRRGQLVVVVAVALLAGLAWIGFGVGFGVTPAASVGGQPVGQSQIEAGRSLVVQPGESLWSIATRIAPGVDPRHTVQQLVDRNGLAGTAIEAGQVLRLP